MLQIFQIKLILTSLLLAPSAQATPVSLDTGAVERRLVARLLVADGKLRMADTAADKKLAGQRLQLGCDMMVAMSVTEKACAGHEATASDISKLVQKVPEVFVEAMQKRMAEDWAQKGSAISDANADGAKLGTAELLQHIDSNISLHNYAEALRELHDLLPKNAHLRLVHELTQIVYALEERGRGEVAIKAM